MHYLQKTYEDLNQALELVVNYAENYWHYCQSCLIIILKLHRI